MFTGIIQKTATVRSFDGKQGTPFRLEIGNPYCEVASVDPIVLGESIAINGVCLTVVGFSPEWLRFDLAPETLSITALSRLRAGRRVNLERAMKLSDRFSGHWVQGHVDGVATVERTEVMGGECHLLEIKLPELSHLKYCVHKGSFTLDGVSLTIHGIRDQFLQFQIIPHTWQETCLSDLYRGDLVNFEVDVLAKYIERLNHEHKT
ncbi:MAG: riboflavin synthase [Bdellovibrionales bacterium]|nr:riboflavin synthase [Bdellovibrionales bacterium]